MYSDYASRTKYVAPCISQLKQRVLRRTLITGEQAYKVTVDDIRRVVVRTSSLEFELTYGLLGRSWVRVPITPLTRELCEVCQDLRIPKDRSIARQVCRWWSRVTQTQDRLSLT